VANSWQSEGELDFYQALMDSAPDAIYVQDVDGNILAANAAASRQTGYANSALLHMRFHQLDGSLSEEALSTLLLSMVREGKAQQVIRSAHRCRDDNELPVEINVTHMPHEGRSLFVAVVRDIRDRVALQKSLEQKVAFNQLLLDISTRLVNLRPESLDRALEHVLADIGHFFSVDRSYLFEIDLEHKTLSNTHEWTADGISPESAQLQKLPLATFPWLIRRLMQHDVVHVPDVSDLPQEALGEKEEWQREGIQSLLMVPILRSGHTAGFVGLDAVSEPRHWTEDIRDNLRLLAQLLASAMDAASMGRELKRLAYHDPLTNLPNRQLLDDRLEQAAARCRRVGRCLAVMLLDLDDFKLINDSLGHGAGDELLCQVSRRLNLIVRDSDTVARLGGDEFVMLFDVASAEDASALAERALETISAPVLIQGHSIVTHLSVGISLLPDDADDWRRMLRNADLAMYAAKAAGKNRFAFYNESMNQRAQDMLSMRFQLGKALQEDQLRLHFQPRVDLASGEICGVEALVRWQHPQRGLLGPGHFLPLAERTDLICAIDHWVLQHACMQARQWQGHGQPIRVAVNLSARDLYEMAHVDRLIAVAQQELDSDRVSLELEITESMLMQDIHTAISHLHRIKEALPDVRVAIDDFGSGYSSLNYLRQLPINTLKIDRSFVMDLRSDSDNAEAIICSIIELARNLGLRVVAEGVETVAERQLLTALGCDEAQGYLYSHPVPSGEIPALLAQNYTSAGE
jgi:diguanylate cyclase (GGDEF)-like protein/PAS domain S-box-containing protein